LAFWVAGIVLLRVAVVPAEHCETPDPAAVRSTIAAASQWIGRGLQPDGTYTYGYLKDVDEVPTEYNPVRHAGAAFTLYMVPPEVDPEAFEAAEAGFEFMTDNFIETEDWAAFAVPNARASLGANGLFLVTLVQRRAATGDASYDDLMRSVGRFLVGQQQPNGSMLAWWDPFTGEPVPDSYGIFATGEAFWGLSLLHRTFPDEGWDEPALAVGRYLANDRDALEGEVTRYPDHWAAYGMAELAAAGVELPDDMIEYARALAGFFSVRTRVEAQRTGEGVNLLVRWYPGPPSGLSTAGEGMAALWRLAGVEARLDDMRPGMVDDLGCMAGMAVDRQFDAAAAAVYPRPELVEGAWFYRNYSQIDDQQHTIAALLEILPALEQSDS